MNPKLILKTVGWVFFPLWAGTLCVIVASLMAGHWVVLPRPVHGAQLPIESFSEAGLNAENDCHTFHFLYSDCACSKRVFKQVLNRKPIANANERIVLVGENSELEASARKQEFDLDVVTPEELKSSYGVESAPLLVITDGLGTIRYSGGYTSRKQGLDVQDVDIIQRTLAGDEVEGLPLYGCAVSKGLQAIVDPLNLK